MNMEEDKEFLKAHMEAHKFMQDLIEKGIEPMAIAGIFQAIATQMYRAMLNDTEFASLMATVIDSGLDMKPEREINKVYH